MLVERKFSVFKGLLTRDVIDNPQSDAGDINYRITFDLVNWKETSIQSLIGDIPQSVCRNSTTMSIREGNCPLPKSGVNRCKSNNNVDIPNSVCEYISDNDQDYTIVLISVQVPFDTPVNTVYAGDQTSFRYTSCKLWVYLPDLCADLACCE